MVFGLTHNEKALANISDSWTGSAELADTTDAPQVLIHEIS